MQAFTNHDRESFLILIADDDSSARTFLRFLLEKEGNRILEADNGKECLDTFRSTKPDIVILDVAMPIMDGCTCCSYLRQLPFGNVPVLMLIEPGNSQSIEQAFAVGATDCVTKPIHPTLLTQRLHRLLRASKAEEEIQRQSLILQAELNRAAEYVRSLLPAPLTEAVTTEWQFIPSQQLGGDIFDYYWLDNDNLVIYLLDVSGHGIRAALLSVSVLNLLRTQSLYNTDFYQPWTVLTELNRVFQMSENGGDYFTIWYGVYNREERQLVYACAGHPPALLSSPCDRSIQELSAQSPPIGLFPELDFDEDMCEITAESRLYLFSDGVYEIVQPDGSIWGINKLTQLITGDRSSKEGRVERLIHRIQTLHQHQAFDDDVSLLQITFE